MRGGTQANILQCNKMLQHIRFYYTCKDFKPLSTKMNLGAIFHLDGIVLGLWKHVRNDRTIFSWALSISKMGIKLSSQIRLLYRLKSKAAISLSFPFNLHCKLIAALFFIMYRSLIWGHRWELSRVRDRCMKQRYWK